MIIKKLHEKTQHAKTNAPCVVQLTIDGEPMQFPISDAVVRDRSDLGINQVVFFVPTTLHNMDFHTEIPEQQPEKTDKQLHPLAQQLKAWMDETGISMADVADEIGITKSSVDSWLKGRWGINSINRQKVINLMHKE